MGEEADLEELIRQKGVLAAERDAQVALVSVSVYSAWGGEWGTTAVVGLEGGVVACAACPACAVEVGDSLDGACMRGRNCPHCAVHLT